MKWQGRNEWSWGFFPACRAIYRQHPPLVILWITQRKHQLKGKKWRGLWYNKTKMICRWKLTVHYCTTLFMDFDVGWKLRAIDILPCGGFSFCIHGTVFLKQCVQLCKILLTIIKINSELPARGLQERNCSMTSSFWATVKLLKGIKFNR